MVTTVHLSASPDDLKSLWQGRCSWFEDRNESVCGGRDFAEGSQLAAQFGAKTPTSKPTCLAHAPY